MVAVGTTDRKCHKESLELAAEMAKRLGLQQVPRQKESVAELMERYQADAVLVALQKELRLHTEAGELFFHPNMSQLPAEKRIDKIELLQVAPVFTEAIARIYEESSVSPLFD